MSTTLDTAHFTAGATGQASGRGARLSFTWWPGPGPVVCLPGLTANRHAFDALARHLAPGIGVLALDLRGRGQSDRPSAGEYGMHRHAADVVAVLDDLGIAGPVVLAGHSMGAYVATQVAHDVPDRVRAVTLLDGGWFPFVPGLDPFSPLVFSGVGPVVEALSRTVPDVETQLELARQGPYYGAALDEVGEAYLRASLLPAEGGWRPACSPDAAREDWADLLTNGERAGNIASLHCPTLAVRAESGLTGPENRVLSDLVMEGIAARVDDLTSVVCPGTNHQTLLLSRSGAACTARAMRAWLTARGLVG